MMFGTVRGGCRGCKFGEKCHASGVALRQKRIVELIAERSYPNARHVGAGVHSSVLQNAGVEMFILFSVSVHGVRASIFYG